MSPLDLSPAETTDSSTHVHPLVESAETWLWGLVAVSFLLDVGLTSYGLSLGLREANPVARAFFSMLGVVEAMLLLKGTVIGMALVAWVSMPLRYRPIVPLGVALPWLVASMINLGLILQL